MGALRELLEKRAGIPVGSFDELVGLASKHLGEGGFEAAKEALNHGGSGSIVIDALTAAPKHLLPFGGEKVLREKPFMFSKYTRTGTVGEGISNRAGDAIWEAKKRLADADMRAGAFVSKKLGPDSGAFKTKITLDGKVNPDGTKNLLDVDAHKITAPFSKAKNFLIPMAGGLYASQLIYPQGQEKREGV